MRESKQVAWNLFSVISFGISGFMIYKGYDKIHNYYSSDTYTDLNKNAYVGGDAYNYIINSGYSTGFYVLALLFVVIGVGFIIAGYLDKLATLKENSMEKIKPIENHELEEEHSITEE